MNFEKLRIRLIAAFLVVSLVPLSVLGYKLMSQGETLIQEKSSAYLKGMAARNAEAIKGFMKERQNDLSNLAGIICLYGLDPFLLKTHVEQMKIQDSPYLGFVLLDNLGHPVFSTLNGDPTGLEDPESWRSVLEPGLESDGDLPGSGTGTVFMFTAGNRQIPALMISTRIKEISGKNCMHLCGLIDFRRVEDLLRKSNIDKTGEVYLVDENGRFLSASRFGANALKDRISISAMAGKTQGLHETVDYRGERVLQAYQKVDTFSWVVLADQDMAEILNRIRAMGRDAVLYGILTAVIVSGLAFFISTMIVNILKAKYLYEKELEFQVIQKEKLASLGLLISGLAHELNTPLANALLYTQVAKEELDESGGSKTDIQVVQQRLATVVDEVRQGSRIVRNLLDFSRHSQSDSQTSDGNKILRQLMDIAGPHCGSRKIEVKMELEKTMPEIRADASTLQAILTNLVANAVDAMPQGGTIHLKTRYVTVLKKVKIEIADSGPGIPQDELTRLFDPFFTTKKSGEGTGLGLFVSYEMARKLGGDIKVVSSTKESSSRSGTVFTLELPTD